MEHEIQIGLDDLIQIAMVLVTAAGSILGVILAIHGYLGRRFRAIEQRQTEQAVQLATIETTIDLIYKALPDRWTSQAQASASTHHAGP